MLYRCLLIASMGPMMTAAAGTTSTRALDVDSTIASDFIFLHEIKSTLICGIVNYYNVDWFMIFK